MSAMFSSLSIFNYRVWASGAIVSNIGTWMQRIAQDWLVLTHLTDNNATAVGVVMALQFGPSILLLPVTGMAADHFDRRKLLMITQGAMGALALGLGLLTITGLVQLWQVFLFAFLLGCVTAFDTPARQTFVSDLVPGSSLSNAVALNSTSFNGARLIGPAVAGVLIAVLGTGWVFISNGLSFSAVLASLAILRTHELVHRDRPAREPGSFMEGFRYVWSRPDLKAILLMLFLLGTFGMNFPIYLSTMSVTVFNAGAGAFGILTSAMALGSVVGALLSARRARPKVTLLLAGASVFAISLAFAAIAPTYALFAIALMIVGVASQTLMTTANSTVQLSTDPAMRGRVIAILMAVIMGGTPIGAPIIGWVANSYGPRAAIGLGAVAGLLSACVGLFYLIRYHHLRLHRIGWRLRISQSEPEHLTAMFEEVSTAR
ncbi:MAG: MFS transporter [Actinomycetota bacterium]|nr:MFS transporter [Actinomycetota bacterium]